MMHANDEEKNDDCPACEAESAEPWVDTWGFDTEEHKAKQRLIHERMKLIAPTTLTEQELAIWNTWMSALATSQVNGDTRILMSVCSDSGPEFAQISQKLRQIAEAE